MMMPHARGKASFTHDKSTKEYYVLSLLVLAGFLTYLYLSMNASITVSKMATLQAFRVSGNDAPRIHIQGTNSNNTIQENVDEKEIILPRSSNLSGTSTNTEQRLDNDQSKAPPAGKLRYDWTNMTLTSPMAKRIEALMNNCSLPLGNTNMFNVNGLGAEVHMWSQKLCNAMEKEWRIRTSPPWQWLDEAICGSSENMVSTMNCYFPKSEARCPGDDVMDENQTQANPIPSPFQERCPSIVENNSKKLSAFRAASMEYLFQSVHPAVIQEAERQLNLVFPRGEVPPDLITVHVRWGDKKEEMELVPAEKYVKAVGRILDKRESSNNTVSVFLATEDPKAVKAFEDAAPKEWNIYLDQYFHEMLPYRNKTNDIYNQAPKTATETKGRAGLIALASLLVAMEANDFVLTLASNWSRMMNELRKNVVDPRCNNCTNMVDLKFAEW